MSKILALWKGIRGGTARILIQSRSFRLSDAVPVPKGRTMALFSSTDMLPSVGGTGAAALAAPFPRYIHAHDDRPRASLPASAGQPRPPGVESHSPTDERADRK